jgi:hypothetical protein
MSGWGMLRERAKSQLAMLKSQLAMAVTAGSKSGIMVISCACEDDPFGDAFRLRRR